MPDRRFLIFLAMIASAIGGIDFLANEYSLYYEITWLDLLAHGLSGLLVSLVAFVFYAWLYRNTMLSHIGFFWVNIVAIGIVAILWEVLELWFEVSLVGVSGGATYWSDTASDFLIGLVGAQVGFLLLIREYKSIFK